MVNKAGSTGRKVQKSAMPMNATCINLVARFVQIARHEGELGLRLNDTDIVKKISNIADRTDNRQLKILHNRLQEELTKHEPAEPLIDEKHEEKSDLKSRFREWTQGFRL